MLKFNMFRRGYYIALLTIAASIQADPVTWQGQNSSNDMNEPANWSSYPDLPGTTDTVVFDSSYPSVNRNPTESSALFDVLALQFPNSASAFTLHFDNQGLILGGVGIAAGSNNPTINATNTVTNTDSVLFFQIFFNGASTVDLGSGTYNVTNTATADSDTANSTPGVIETNQFATNNAASIESGASFTISNTGTDTTSGYGNNVIAPIYSNQMQFGSTTDISNNVGISVSNNATFNGNNTTSDLVGNISGYQFYAGDDVQAGSSFNFSVTNTGSNTNNGAGNTNGDYSGVGSMGASQASFTGNLQIGDSSIITVQNYGSNSGTETSENNLVSIINFDQFIIGGDFQTGKNASITINNTGIDDSTGRGGNTIVQIEGSDALGYQMYVGGTTTLDSGVSLTLSNSGTFTGSSTTGSPEPSSIAEVNSGQASFVGAFSAGDSFNANISNTGTDSSLSGNVNIVAVAGGQLFFGDACSVGEDSTIYINNSCNYSGSSSATTGYYNVGSSTAQLMVTGAFGPGSNPNNNSFSLTVENMGVRTTPEGVPASYGSAYVGSIEQHSQVSFFGACIVGDNATLKITNSGQNSSNTTDVGTFVGYVPSGGQTTVAGAFSAGQNLNVTVSNEGQDSSLGFGSNSVGYVLNASQLLLAASSTIGSGATITISNSGISSSTETGNNHVGDVPDQLTFGTDGSDSLIIDGPCTFTITNYGKDTSTGAGGNTVGNVGANGQLTNNGSTTITGGTATFTVSNYGENSGNTTAGNSVSNITNIQCKLEYNVNIEESLQLTVTNEGINSSTGAGDNSISNIGADGQLAFNDACTIGGNSAITVSNSGTNSGSTTSYGNVVALVNNAQIFTGPFTVTGDSFQLTVKNTGLDTGASMAPDLVGYCSGDAQVYITGLVSLQNSATFIISNSGTNSSNGTSSNSVGFTAQDQLYVSSGTPSDTFSALDHFTLDISNTGVNSSTDLGSHLVGVADNGCQMNSTLAFSFEDYATIKICNSGTNSGSNSTGGNSVGYIENQQFYLQGGTSPFSANDYLTLTVKNYGNDGSSGIGGNDVGVVNDGSQFQCDTTFTVQDNATITVSNEGIYSGSCSGFNEVGYVSGDAQFYVVGDFYAGESLNLTITNSGTNSCTVAGGHSVGVLHASTSQFETDSTFTTLDNATITVTNSGTNSSSTTGNNVGTVGYSQVYISETFSAGKNLNMTITNNGTNTGNSDNTVGTVGGPQAYFADTCTVDDGSTITVSNEGTGTVFQQILFSNGFTVTSGKAIFQASNSTQGTVTDDNILIQGTNTGGNAEIVLANASLNIGSSGSTFTIGGLSGDNLSSAVSTPQLIISTDSSTNAVFAGEITAAPSLVKTGPGSQKLSGVNSYTGLTTIQQGTLIVAAGGSLAGSVNINPAGILKGSGTIGGNVVNAGTIAPGESIGTLPILGNYTNNGGNYDVEVSANGVSDLIDVTGTATLNGGIVYVGTSDGLYTFQEPYLILTSGNLNGTFSGAIPLSPFLDPSLSYIGNNVYLTLETFIARAAKTCNQRSVAIQLDSIIDPNANQTLLLSEIIDLAPNAAREALDSLSGYQHTDDVWTVGLINRQFIRRLYEPLRPIVTTDLSCDCQPCFNEEWIVWGDTGGGHTSLTGGGEAHGFSMNTYELTAGIQKTFCPELTCGFAVSYEYDHMHYKHGEGSGKNNTYLLGLYGLWRPADFYTLVDLTYGYSPNTVKRNIVAGPLEYLARSHPKITQKNFYGEVGVDCCYGCVLVQPFAGLEVAENFRRSITEKESHGFALAINGKKWSTTTARLGVHLTTSNVYEGINVSLDMAWDKLLSSRRNSVYGEFIEFGDSYKILGVTQDDNGFDYSLNVSSPLIDNLTGYIELNGECWKHLSTFNLLCGLELVW